MNKRVNPRFKWTDITHIILVQLVACDWKEWPLDTLRRLRGQQPVEEELDMRTADEIEVGWNPKHTILNQFKYVEF